MRYRAAADQMERLGVLISESFDVVKSRHPEETEKMAAIVNEEAANKLGPLIAAGVVGRTETAVVLG